MLSAFLTFNRLIDIKDFKDGNECYMTALHLILTNFKVFIPSLAIMSLL